MSVRLPDVVAACRIIQTQRRAQRKMKRKYITVNFNNDEKINIGLVLALNPVTGTVKMGHCLRYCLLAFYPTTNQKLRCTNQHALDLLNYRRNYIKQYNIKRKRICKTA